MRWVMLLLSIALIGGGGLVAIYTILPGTFGLVAGAGWFLFVGLAALVLHLLLSPRKKKSSKPRPGAKGTAKVTMAAPSRPAASVPTIAAKDAVVVPQEQQPEPPREVRRQIISMPLIRPDTAFMATGDDDEDFDTLVGEQLDSIHNLRVAHHTPPHLEASPPDPDTRPNPVVYTPFADESEIREAIENSQVIHIPRNGHARSQRDYPQSRNHGNHPRKRTNRGGGNRRRYLSDMPGA